MDLKLDGRTAAVAAASSGLGLASATALAAEGARVVICGRDEEKVAAASRRIGPAGVGLVADVGTPDGASSFVAAATEAVGPLDILVTNAGGPPAGTFAATEVAAYLGALDLNLLSVVAMCRAAVPGMAERGWGRVVAITSMGARQPIPGMILSNTARAGATAFLKSLATEVAPRGVTVNSVQPGSHATARLAAVVGGDLSSLAASIPRRVVGEPADFGSVVAFLCSEQAGYVTGTAIPVDGGACLGLQ